VLIDLILLEEFRSDLQNMIEGISHSLNLEAAVFDSQNHIIASTPTYLNRKGHAVHAPSIEEVIMNGNILVNKPGYMKSCIGCRFTGNCPATIEILNCIKYENKPIGVITLTSFTKNGHNKITENLHVYVNIVNRMTEFISNLISCKYKSNQIRTLQKILQSTLDMSNKGILVIDKNGFVNFSNPVSEKLFSFCGLYSQSIHQLLPEPFNKKIMKGRPVNEILRSKEINGKVISSPLFENDQFQGAVLQIVPENIKDYDGISQNNQKQKFSMDDIKGSGPAINLLKNRIKKIAKSSSTVLITGETGTGKGLAAKAIHHESIRCNFPFIVINCASIPETLFESELFGYEEGAFTGAKKGGKLGQFELAQNGTLFLDEIGEMPLHIQAKLLKVLQDQTIERVGGTSSIPIDVRIIAATNKNLIQMVENQKFREDLYYRLNVIPMEIPSLASRIDDIEELSHEFLKKYTNKLNKKIDGFSNDVLRLFYKYDWPGNIRELENVIEYVVNMEEANIIQLTSLPEKFGDSVTNNAGSIKKRKDDMELKTICNALNKHGWNVKGKKLAAEELGIGLRTLYRKLQKLQLKCEYEYKFK